MPLSFQRESVSETSITYCRQCRHNKPSRSHHCKRCNKCVLKYDHHVNQNFTSLFFSMFNNHWSNVTKKKCTWINACIGFGNYKYFFSTLFWASIGSLYMLGLIAYRWYFIEEDLLVVWKLAVFTSFSILMLTQSVLITVLFVFHIYLNIFNMVTISLVYYLSYPNVYFYFFRRLLNIIVVKERRLVTTLTEDVVLIVNNLLVIHVVGCFRWNLILNQMVSRMRFLYERSKLMSNATTRLHLLTNKFASFDLIWFDNGASNNNRTIQFGTKKFSVGGNQIRY